MRNTIKAKVGYVMSQIKSNPWAAGNPPKGVYYE